MVLHPSGGQVQRAAQSGNQALPIWNAIQAAQLKKPAGCIDQIDHARLTGEIAQHLDPEIVPPLDAALIDAISLHDEGWGELDSKPPVRTFLDVQPPDFLKAWRGSIDAARQVSELGGQMVGGHFYRLGKARLEHAANAPSDSKLLQAFLEEREQVRSAWQATASVSQEQLESLIDLLQFCDVFSLYLCSGADERVQFPQRIGGTIFQLYRQNDWCVTSPPLFASTIQLEVKTWEVTRKGTKGESAILDFQLR
jgi:Protein of unknown function (DUF3891)